MRSIVLPSEETIISSPRNAFCGNLPIMMNGLFVPDIEKYAERFG